MHRLLQMLPRISAGSLCRLCRVVMGDESCIVIGDDGMGEKRKITLPGPAGLYQT